MSYFSVAVIIAILVISTLTPLWKLEPQNYAIQDAVAQLPPSSSLQSQQVQQQQQQENQDPQTGISLSQLNSNNSSSNTPSQTPSSLISAHSINNTNMTAAEFPPGTNFTKMVGPNSELSLALSKLAIDIPMQKGYENGNEIYFVTFDASDNGLSLQITNNSNDFPVHYTKLLAQTPSEATEEAYIFTNGINGTGHLGYQPTIVEASPSNETYSPLKHVNLVEWTTPSSARELKSIQELVNAQNAGEITVNTTSTELVINSPAIKWHDGSLKIREDKVITDKTPFIGGQVTNIDTERMVVTMVAMRGYGPDGKTIYWSVTDGTPFTDDITKGGIVYAPKDDVLADTAVAVDFYQFINGMRDAGPQGFQPPVSPVNLEDENYSPMWRILFVAWKDPQQARVVQTMSDLNQMRKEGLIEITPALEGRHIVNCPFFDQSTVLKFRHEYTEEELQQFEQYNQQQLTMQSNLSPSNIDTGNAITGSISTPEAYNQNKTVSSSTVNLTQQQEESTVKKITTIVDIVEGSSFPDNEIFYNPTTVTVSQGDKVVWINKDSVIHTVTSGLPDQENAGQLFDSKNMGPDGIFEHTFDEAGEYDYYCTLHPFMVGSVIVE
ncbi:MAG: plastocyanin/azurin family copper-binding protein [Nitrososphaeraceae archaeon]